jgi:hypothetical protein
MNNELLDLLSREGNFEGENQRFNRKQGKEEEIKFFEKETTIDMKQSSEIGELKKE